MGRLVLILSSSARVSLPKKLGWYPQVTSGSTGSFSLFSAAIRRLKKSSLSFTAGIVPKGRTQSSIDRTSDAIVSAVNTGWSCCATNPGTIIFSAKVLSIEYFWSPAAVFNSASVPVASIRSPTTATACAIGFAVSSVMISLAV